jgi:protein-S-isoprenylcysteine O-methyltransferase Ste14
VQRYCGAVTLLLVLGMVWSRVLLLKAQGTRAMKFGSLDKTDFVIPPFATFYIYVVFAAAFHWPTVSRQELFHSGIASWAGVLCSLTGLVFFFLSLVSFGQSFRVGIDADHPGALVTTGVFGISRNPIYVAFGFILLGEFLLLPNWIPLIYLLLGFWLLNRQASREEGFLRECYGQAFANYAARVRKYL